MRDINILIFYIFNNMENIIEPNENFDFSNITLAHPFSIQGGAFFTKIENNKKPLYVQTSKSLTRQGFVKTGKKYYCDLMFDKNSEQLINWFENLEEKCHKLIFEKKESWFQSNLEENDIDSAFNPIIRTYKSGKYYLIRTNIKNTKDDTPVVKIYNEKEISLNLNDINQETEVISILEIQGIRFTTRNFQIEIELKQVMVLDNEKIFDNCLIKTKKPLMDNKINDNLLDNKVELNENTNIDNDNVINEFHEETIISSDIISNTLEELGTIDIMQSEDPKNESVSFDIEFEDLSEDINENNDELREINNNDLNLEKNSDIFTLKKPNQVYYELYKEARNKAKQAKKNAILAYLEAKNIKKTYLIENVNDSDSEFENEIDDVSESELEGL